MRNLTKMAVILLIIAMAFGCSSTNGSKSNYRRAITNRRMAFRDHPL